MNHNAVDFTSWASQSIAGSVSGGRRSVQIPAQENAWTGDIAEAWRHVQGFVTEPEGALEEHDLLARVQRTMWDRRCTSAPLWRDRPAMPATLRDLACASTLLDLFLYQGRETMWERVDYEAWNREGGVLGYLNERIEQHVSEARQAFLERDEQEAGQ